MTVLQIDHSQSVADEKKGWVHGTTSPGKIHRADLARLVLGLGWGGESRRL